MQKRKIKSTLWLCGIALTVVILVLLPFLMEARAGIVADDASILSAKAERSTISTSLTGAGTLSAQEPVSVSVPDGVKLTEYLVETGAQVEEGDPLAKVDALSVMTAIREVQDTLDILNEQIEAAADKAAETDLTATVGGRVMRVYCSEGDNVKDVMLAHGALALVSLDGLLKVTFETEADLATGDAVTVTLPDGTEVAGRVEASLAGAVSVTIPDDAAALDAQVTVSDERGKALGGGALELHNPWRAIAYTGTVKAVKVTQGEEISDGKTICTLEDTEDASEYALLTAKHRVYEELLTELFALYQKRTVYAAQAGTVTLPEDQDAYLLCAGEQNYQLIPLANAPSGDDETQYLNFVGTVTEATAEGLQLKMQLAPVEVTDYLEFSQQPISLEQMTEETVFVPTEATPVFYLQDGAWQQGMASELRAGDVLLFAYTPESKEPVWLVKLPAQEPPTDDQPEDKPDDNKPSEEKPTPNPNPNPNPNWPGSGQGFDFQLPSGYESYFSGLQQGQFSQSALYAQYGGTPMEEAVVTLYSEEETEIMTLTPCTQMELEITVDELDILKTQPGQTATVTVDALPGRSFPATVCEVSTTGTNAGGSSKFTVTLTMERAEQMLDGMNAFALIPLEQHENVLTVPVAALVEQGSRTYVYRSYGADDGLGSLTEVTTGLSDGEVAEIRSGLEAGDEIWYPYYDKVKISNAVEPSRPNYFG